MKDNWGYGSLAIQEIQLYILTCPCKTDSDCPHQFACGNDEEYEECVEPQCPPDCATNAHCEGSNHIGICACDIEYPVGDPYVEGCNRKERPNII